MAKTVGKRKKNDYWSVFGFIVFPMVILCRAKKALGGPDQLGTAIGKLVSQKGSWSTGFNADLHPLRMGYNSPMWLLISPGPFSNETYPKIRPTAEFLDHKNTINTENSRPQ
jgi:hypothetical protein